MAVSYARCAADEIPRLAALMADPGFGDEFSLVPIARQVADPSRDPDTTWLALANGDPVGFAFAIVPHGARERFAMVRLGVLLPWRRRGIGSELLARAAAPSRAGDPPAALYVSTWLPNAAAAAFARGHGFEHSRFYWHMERAPALQPTVEWPAGIEVRTFDGSDAALADWCGTYNASFAEHHLSAVATPDECRTIAAQPGFRPDGLALAYRDGRAVGYIGNSLQANEGLVEVLGVAPEARGIGLGRALLRWGVAWLTANGAPRVALLVDGQNESALRLYRSEGFAVTRTREIWRQPPESH